MKKILLVEDDEDISDAVSLYLPMKGYAVTTCLKVESYGSYVNTINQVDPDIIVSDVFLPNIDGRELCRYIKNTEKLNKIPYLLMSAGNISKEEIAASKSDFFIAKPFDISELEKAVGSLLG